jgi:hypothetical protein
MAHLISYSCRSLAHSPPARDERRDLPVNTLTLFPPTLFFSLLSDQSVLGIFFLWLADGFLPV